MLKVMLVSTNEQPLLLRAWGGIECQVEQQAIGLAAAGLDVHVATVAPGAAPGAAFERDGVTWHLFPHARGGERRPDRLLGLAAAYGFAVASLARRLGPAIVHHHARYPCFFARLAQGPRPAPWRTIFHAHNRMKAELMDYGRQRHRRLAAIAGAGLDARIARGVDHVAGVSAFIRDSVIRTARIDPLRASVITNIVDGARFHPAAGNPGSPVILFIGRLAAEKGLMTLLEAFGQLLATRPDAELRIVGPDASGTETGAYRRDCLAWVTARGLADRVRFLGEIPHAELPAQIRQAGVVAVPSVWGEPCGLVVLEAMACGVPVVASRVGGIPELVDDGRTGLLVPPADPPALAAALARALADAAGRHDAYRLGPERIARRHAWPSIAQELLGLYRTLLDDPAAAGLRGASLAFAGKDAEQHA